MLITRRTSALRSPVGRGALALLGLLVSAGLLVTTPARAEDPVAADSEAPTPTTPPEFSGGADAFTTPGATGNLLDWLNALQEQLLRLRTPPPTSPRDTQLRGAWDSILAPRLGSMSSRFEKWQDSARWVAVSGDPSQVLLAEDQWPGFVQSMAYLFSELHGAAKQYRNVTIRRKSGPTVRPPHTGEQPLLRLTYPVAGLYNSILLRQAAARQWGFARTNSHSHLLGRFRTAWNWSWDQSSAWVRYLERKDAQESLERYEQALEVALQGTRDTLSNTLLGLQAFVAAVQDGEQQRLRSICLACSTEDATLREMAETALRDMEGVQLEAERFQDNSYLKYSVLLRAWLRRHTAAVRVLEITDKRLTEDPVAMDGASEQTQAPDVR